MRDTMARAAAVFEPEEIRVLASALAMTLRRLDSRRTRRVLACEVAKLVHNLGRSRITFGKPMQTDRHAAEIADEAVEHFDYLVEAPDAVVAAVREESSYPASERIVGAFPNAFRQTPVNRL